MPQTKSNKLPVACFRGEQPWPHRDLASLIANPYT